ncbi:MAG: restriction endonuclease [Sulfuricella sp.]|nr:restriction endonuclease [Sulfuricella sp.]
MLGLITTMKSRGFGFINSPELSDDIFFHWSKCIGGLKTFDLLHPGNEVSFDVQVGANNKPIAANVNPKDFSSDKAQALPEITLKSVLEPIEKTTEGDLVTYIADAWLEIVRILLKDPEGAYQIGPRKWEEIIAGAWSRAGFDQVELTPRSGDKGRDVIACKYGVGSIRIVDQVKAYKPGHVVTAEEVRAMIGVISLDPNVSKGVITTTSTFAPRLLEDRHLKDHIPYRLELKSRETLFPWLSKLSQEAADSASAAPAMWLGRNEAQQTQSFLLTRPIL